MATKRKSSAPPPLSSSDEYSSSEEEEQAVGVPQPTPSLAKTPNKRSRSDSDSDTESESDPEPPKSNPKASQTEPESSSDEEEEEEEKEEEENVEKPNSATKDGSKSEKKKQKVSDPYQTPSQKSPHVFPRIWTQKDEMVLLPALAEYRARQGQLPLTIKDCASFLPTISGSISFPVTDKQLGNKIRQLKRAYERRAKKGSDAILDPHDKAVFKLCSNLFEVGGSSSKVYKKKEKDKHAMAGATDGGMANNGAVRGDGPADNCAARGGGAARSNFYLRGLIEDLMKETGFRWIPSVEAAIAVVGESKANELEAKTKMLRIDAMELRPRENMLKAELIDTLVDQMTND